MNSMASLEIVHLINILSEHFFLFCLCLFVLPCRSFAYILWLSVLFFYRIPVCMNVCLCDYMYFSCFFYDFFFCLFGLVCTILVCLFCFILFYHQSLDACLLSNKRQMGRRGCKENLKRVGERKTVIRIYCMKNVFSIKEKIKYKTRLLLP